MRPKVLLLFPNTSNEGVMPLAIAILSMIAKEVSFNVRYFETSFYKKNVTAAEERERTGEFKSVDRENIFELLPYDYLKRDFQRALLDYRPDILAVSANSLEYELFCELMEGVKFAEAKPFVIIGGVHATVACDDVIDNIHVDAVCIGEGEEAWKEFLVNFKRGDGILNIRNLWVKNGSRVYKNPLRPLLNEEELWEEPLDLSFFTKKHFLKPFDGAMYHRGQIEVSRGCPYSCAYCVNSGFKDIYKGLGKFVRIRPFNSLKKGIEEQIRLGAEMLQLQDECFLSIPCKMLEDFCHWYSTKINLPLLVQTRPETITEEKVKLLAAMNIPVQISCGVESGSERILKEICNRHTTIKQIKNAFEIIKKYRLRSTAYTMIGFPTETREEVFETIYLIRQLKVDISIMSVFFPFKGVPLRQFCIEKGYISGDEKTKTFTDMSILKNQPMSKEEVYNLRRTYSLYTRLPEEYFPQIELCERDFEKYKDLFNEFVQVLYKSYYNTWKLK